MKEANENEHHCARHDVLYLKDGYCQQCADWYDYMNKRQAYETEIYDAEHEDW